MSTVTSPELSLKARVPLLRVTRAIFHFVPVHKRHEEGMTPTLMDEETPLDADSTHLIQERVKRTLTSSHAYDVAFDPARITAVKGLVEAYISDRTLAAFVTTSQQLASCLFTVQKGSNSPGLLCMLDCSLGSEFAVAIVKLESETGSRLFEEQDAGHRRYRMNVLRDLFLTEGTRVFKSALFLSTGNGLTVLACDDQRSSTKEYELARFFLEQFLGCKRLEAPQVITKRFYNTVVQFLNERVEGAVAKSDLYDDLTSQLRRRTGRINVREFAREFVPRDKQDEFVDFLAERAIPGGFPKDTSEITSYLRKKHIRTAHNIQIHVPEDAEEFVRVEANRIVISDAPTGVRGG